MLTLTYGDYFLAECIEAQDEDHRALVAEFDGGAIAFMSVSADVNTQLLAECFELGPLHGLRKPHPEDVLSEAGSVVNGGEDGASTDGAGGGGATTAPSNNNHNNNTLTDGPGFEEDSKSSGRKGGGGGADKSVLTDSKGSLATSVGKDASGGSSGAASATVAAADVVVDDEDDDAGIDHEDISEYLPSYAQRLGRLPGSAAAGGSPFRPIYKGASNVFCVQLFCIHEEFEMRSLDFLPKVFELFPDRDYCIVTVPHLVPEFPLLQQFVRATPRHSSTLPQV